MNMMTFAFIVVFATCVYDMQTLFTVRKLEFVYLKPQYLIVSVIVVAITSQAAWFISQSLYSGEFDMYFFYLLVFKHIMNFYNLYSGLQLRERIVVRGQRSVVKWEGVSKIKHMIYCTVVDELYLTALTVVWCRGL